MTTYLAAIGLILLLLIGGLAVERAYRRFIPNHPSFGPFRKEGTGCCGACGGGTCDREDKPA